MQGKKERRKERKKERNPKLQLQGMNLKAK